MLLSSVTHTSSYLRRSRSWLVCMDLQREYVIPGRPLYAEGAGRTAEACGRLLGHARARGWRVIHAQRRHCDGLFDRAGYFGAPIEGLRPLISEPVFARSSLSAFCNADFAAELRDALGEDVFLMGFSLGASCLATALGAVDAGLRITVVSDAAGAAPAPGLDHRLAREAAISLLSPLVRLASSLDVIEAAEAEGALP